MGAAVVEVDEVDDVDDVDDVVDEVVVGSGGRLRWCHVVEVVDALGASVVGGGAGSVVEVVGGGVVDVVVLGADGCRWWCSGAVVVDVVESARSTLEGVGSPPVVVVVGAGW